VASSSIASTPTSTHNGITTRGYYQMLAKKNFPNIVATTDTELIMLGSGQFKGKDEDFPAFIKEQNESRLKCMPGDKDINMARSERNRKKRMDAPLVIMGLKPELGIPLEYVRSRPIPNSDYSLRLFSSSRPEAGEFGLDFVHTSTGEPVNSPFEFELWAVSVANASWVPMPRHRLRSLEEKSGRKTKDLKPGTEKFIVKGGMACVLKRPGFRDVYFKVPVLPRNIPEVDLQNYDVVTFDS